MGKAVVKDMHDKVGFGSKLKEPIYIVKSIE
jgi:hypothetical protein